MDAPNDWRRVLVADITWERPIRYGSSRCDTGAADVTREQPVCITLSISFKIPPPTTYTEARRLFVSAQPADRQCCKRNERHSSAYVHTRCFGRTFRRVCH